MSQTGVLGNQITHLEWSTACRCMENKGTNGTTFGVQTNLDLSVKWRRRAVVGRIDLRSTHFSKQKVEQQLLNIKQTNIQTGLNKTKKQAVTDPVLNMRF
ncbi:hypothetical protein BsWGS_24839 [Bradybaena similaris]